MALEVGTRLGHDDVTSLFIGEGRERGTSPACQAARSIRSAASSLRCRLVLTQKNPTTAMAIVVTRNIISNLPRGAQTMRPEQSNASIVPRSHQRIAGRAAHVFPQTSAPEAYGGAGVDRQIMLRSESRITISSCDTAGEENLQRHRTLSRQPAPEAVRHSRPSEHADVRFLVRPLERWTASA